MNLTFKIIALLLMSLICYLSVAADTADKPKQEEQKWWEKRYERTDIQFPHNVHIGIVDQEGDACMLCHSFNKNNITDQKTLKQITNISNEPLKAICHDCHVKELRGPWRCVLCHNDREKIWPDNHNFNYIDHHGEDARHDETTCNECHIDRSFCTDCHMKRDTTGEDYHPPGYRTMHGMEARMMSFNCARCHNSFYCINCHSSR